MRRAKAMRAPISVVIPVLNAEKQLAHCAAALIEGVEAGLIRELIVTDGGSTDETQLVADEVGAVWIRGAASRGGQLKRGCVAARGDWILVLHADTILDAGWSVEVATHLNSSDTRYFTLAFASGGLPARFVAGWANLRSRLFGLPYGDQGLLISRALYERVGGFQDMPLMEDVAMARTLRGGLRPLKTRAVTSATKYETSGWIRRGSRNLLTLLRYFAGVSVEKLAASYRKP